MHRLAPVCLGRATEAATGQRRRELAKQIELLERPRVISTYRRAGRARLRAAPLDWRHLHNERFGSAYSAVAAMRFRSQSVLVLRAPVMWEWPDQGQVGSIPAKMVCHRGAGGGWDHLGYACSAQANCDKFEPQSIFPPL